MDKVKNLTPHSVTLVKPDGHRLHLDPDGPPARMTELVKPTGREVLGLPINQVSYGEVYDLPDQEDGVWLLVSNIVRTCLPERKDLLGIGETMRDKSGNVLAAINLLIN